MCKACVENFNPAPPEQPPKNVLRVGLHAHQCVDCLHFFGCLKNPCPTRGTEADAQWICGCIARTAMRKGKAA